jgi:hypothetical protein
MLCGSTPNFQLKMKLNEPLPRPIYKERAFALNVLLTDLKGNSVGLPETTKFKILLFTTEDPPKLMKVSTSGDKIMRGTIDVTFDPGTSNMVL